MTEDLGFSYGAPHDEIPPNVCEECGAEFDGDLCPYCTNRIAEIKASLAVLVDAARQARDQIRAVEAECKGRLDEAKTAMIPLLQELERLTGAARYKDEFGTTTLVIRSPAVSYDKALDAMLEDHPWLKAHRKITEYKPSVRLG